MSNRHSRRGWEGLEQLEARQVLSTVSWDGGGGDFNWDNPMNWSGDALPGAADDVIIDVAGTPTILHNQNTTESIHSLTSNEAIHLSAGTITLGGEWKQGGTMTMSGGRIDGTGDFSIGNSLLWTAGTIAGGGKFKVVTGHATTIAGNVELSRNLDNDGVLVWDSGDIVTGSGVIIRNLAGRTMQFKSAGTISGGASLVNEGILSRNGLANTTSTVAIRFDNIAGNVAQNIAPGVVVAHKGTLSFTGTVVNKEGDTLKGAKWVVSSSDGKLLFPGVDIAHVVGTPGAMLPRVTLIGANASFPQLENAHDISVLTLSGGRQFTFPNLQQLTLLTLVGGMTVPHSLNTDQLVAVMGDTTMAQGMTARSVYVGTGITLMLNGTTTLHDSIVFGPGLLRVGGDVNWQSGIITGQGAMLINASGKLLMNDGASAGSRQLTRRTINYGTIDLNDGTHSFMFANEIVNRGTLEVRATDGFIGTPANAPALISNYGTMNVRDSVTLRAAGGAVGLANTGTIHVTNGTFIANGGESGGGAWVIDGGAEMAFGGKDANLIGANFSGGGRVRVANHSTWTNASMSGAGDMIVTAPGTLDLAGATTVLGRSSVTNNGRVNLVNGAVARIESGMTNAGVLDVDTGRLDITGDLVMTPTSAVRVRTTDATTIGKLNVGGAATVNGSLNVDFDWTPSMGFNLAFITTGSHTGDFTQVTSTGLPPDMGVQFAFTGNTGGFTVIDV